MNSRQWWGASVAIGVLLTGGVYRWFAADPLLTGSVGLFWTIGLGLSHRHWAIWGRNDGVSWWSGAFGGLATFAATISVTSFPPDLGFTVGLFIIGVCLTMVNIGIELAHEHGDHTRSEQATGNDLGNISK